MDNLQSFIFEEASVRGALVHVTEAYQSIIKQHDYPPRIKQLLGEALVGCLIMTSNIKFEGELILQFQGDERLPLLLIQCDNLLNVRAYAKYKKDLDTVDYEQAFLSGQMVVTMNQYRQTEAYQSIVPLLSTSMSENISNYFTQSEQLSTQVWLAVDEDRAAGMVLQLMPSHDTIQREHFWEYATQIGRTLTEHELLYLDNPTLLYRLYHETEVRLFEDRFIHFKCHCTKEKMIQVLKVLGEHDVKQLAQERGEVAITCDFCNTRYVFDPIDISMLFL